MLQSSQTFQKLSKLNDLGTPFRLFKSFFDDALADMFVGYTKLYGQREKAEVSFEITNEAFCSFFGMLLLSGGRKIPD